MTSQLPVTDWHEYLGGGRVADAILDRIVHASHRIELASKDSMRKTTPTCPMADSLYITNRLTSLRSDAVRHHRISCPSWPEYAGHPLF